MNYKNSRYKDKKIKICKNIYRYYEYRITRYIENYRPFCFYPGIVKLERKANYSAV